MYVELGDVKACYFLPFPFFSLCFVVCFFLVLFFFNYKSTLGDLCESAHWSLKCCRKKLEEVVQCTSNV